ncbi:MAG TPA: hypothetical protein VHF51_00455 [Solirubrobacteraceae bacterium]|jgi:hypothetical protein|nr:hypothetical protein [Solirubrobacteraceae bacterium]
MPDRLSIAALAVVVALAAPVAAVAQDEPSGTPPAAENRAPAHEPAPTPDHEAGDQGQDEPGLGVAEPESQPTPARTAPAQSTPGSGIDLLPLAVAGLALALVGLALRGRPHARR